MPHLCELRHLVMVAGKTDIRLAKGITFFQFAGNVDKIETNKHRSRLDKRWP